MSTPNGAEASNVIETLVAHFFYPKEIPVLRVQTFVTSLVLLATLALTGQAVAQTQLPADLTDKIDKVATDTLARTRQRARYPRHRGGRPP